MNAIARNGITALSLLLAQPATATEVSDLCTGNPCVISGNHTIDSGSDLDFGATTVLEIASNAKLKVGPTEGLARRPITLRAAQITMKSGAKIEGDGARAAVTLEATDGDLEIASGADIDLKDNSAGTLLLKATGDITVAGDVTASASGLDAEAGRVTVEASGAAALTGDIGLNASGSGSGGGELLVLASGNIDVASDITTKGGEFGGGPIEFNSALGSITFAGSIDASGGGPDGEAGSIDIIATQGSIDINGSMKGKGGAGAEEACGDGSPLLLDAGVDVNIRSELEFIGGAHCLGGELDFVAGGNVTMWEGSKIVVKAGGAYGGGGGLTVTATGSTTITDVQLTSPGGGGFVDIVSGSNTDIQGHLDARGSSGDAFGGNVILRGCGITVAAGAEVHSHGGFIWEGLGVNEFRSSGPMTIAGTVLASFANDFEWKTVAPVITGTVDPPPTITQNPELFDCASACGDGTVDEGETCDDGNLRDCDGCNSDCSRVDAICGDGTIECNEICDDGNSENGDGCESTCAPTGASGVRIKGNKDRLACLLQWDVVLAQPEINRFTGRADNKQECIDGDPGCDADDAVNGKCLWDIAGCVAVPDEDLPLCNAGAIEHLKLRKPRVDFGNDTTNIANAFVVSEALKGLGGTVKSGTNTLQTGPAISTPGVCTDRFLFEIPIGRRGKSTSALSVGARDDAGHLLVGNKLSLTCVENDAVCGNDEQEIGERCDDGNVLSCDGCSSDCRIEACGNGTLECNEQCDEGDDNGTEASRCSSSCLLSPTDLRIPGGGSKKTDCVAEWVVETSAAGIQTAKNGLPKPIVSCNAGDPDCDFDLDSAGCQFRVWGCFGGADSRIGCTAQGASQIDLRRPSPRSRKATDQAARGALLSGFGEVSLETPGEVCTRAMSVDVPSGEKLSMSIKTGIAGVKKKDGDRLKLICR